MRFPFKIKRISSPLDTHTYTRVDGFLSGCIQSPSGQHFIRYATFLNHIKKIASQCGLQLTSGTINQGGLIVGQNLWRLTSECFAVIVTVTNVAQTESDGTYGSHKLNDFVSVAAVYFEFNHDKAVPCPELAMDLSKGMYSSLREHIDNLLTIYAVPGDKIDRARAYLCLQALEKDLSMLTQAWRLDLVHPDAATLNLKPHDIVNRSLVGHLVGRTGGRLALLTYMVTSAQAIMYSSTPNGDSNCQQVGRGSVHGFAGGFLARIGLCPRLVKTDELVMSKAAHVSTTVQRLPFIPLVTLQKDSSGCISVPHFAQPDEIKCISIEAEFVFHLDPPIPMTSEAVLKMERITGLTNSELADQVEEDIVLLILRQHKQEHLYGVNVHVKIPNLTQHSYRVDSELRGYLVKSIPFTCSNQIGELIAIMREQASACAFYETFVIHPNIPVKKDPILTFSFNVQLLPNRIIALDFDHPLKLSKHVLITLQVNSFDVQCINFIDNASSLLNIFNSSPAHSNPNRSKLIESLGRILTQTHALPTALVWLFKQFKCPISNNNNNNMHYLEFDCEANCQVEKALKRVYESVKDTERLPVYDDADKVKVEASVKHQLQSDQLINLRSMLKRVQSGIGLHSDLAGTGGVMSGGIYTNPIDFGSINIPMMMMMKAGSTSKVGLDGSVGADGSTFGSSSLFVLLNETPSVYGNEPYSTTGAVNMSPLPPGVMITPPPNFQNIEEYSDNSTTPSTANATRPPTSFNPTCPTSLYSSSSSRSLRLDDLLVEPSTYDSQSECFAGATPTPTMNMIMMMTDANGQMYSKVSACSTTTISTNPSMIIKSPVSMNKSHHGFQNSDARTPPGTGSMLVNLLNEDSLTPSSSPSIPSFLPNSSIANPCLSPSIPSSTSNRSANLLLPPPPPPPPLASPASVAGRTSTALPPSMYQSIANSSIVNRPKYGQLKSSELIKKPRKRRRGSSTQVVDNSTISPSSVGVPIVSTSSLSISSQSAGFYHSNMMKQSSNANFVRSNFVNSNANFSTMTNHQSTMSSFDVSASTSINTSNVPSSLSLSSSSSTNKSVYDFDDTASSSFDLAPAATSFPTMTSPKSQLGIPPPPPPTSFGFVADSAVAPLATTTPPPINPPAVCTSSTAPIVSTGMSERTVERKTSLKMTIKTVPSNPPLDSTAKSTLDTKKLPKSGLPHSKIRFSYSVAPNPTLPPDGTKKVKRRSVDGKPSAYMLQKLQHHHHHHQQTSPNTTVTSFSSAGGAGGGSGSASGSVIMMSPHHLKSNTLTSKHLVKDKLLNHGQNVVKKERKRRLNANPSSQHRTALMASAKRQPVELTDGGFTATTESELQSPSKISKLNNNNNNNSRCSISSISPNASTSGASTTTIGYYTTYTSVSPKMKKKVLTTYQHNYPNYARTTTTNSSNNSMSIASTNSHSAAAAATTTITTTTPNSSTSSAPVSANIVCPTPVASSNAPTYCEPKRKRNVDSGPTQSSSLEGPDASTVSTANSTVLTNTTASTTTTATCKPGRPLSTTTSSIRPNFTKHSKHLNPVGTSSSSSTTTTTGGLIKGYKIPKMKNVTSVTTTVLDTTQPTDHNDESPVVQSTLSSSSTSDQLDNNVVKMTSVSQPATSASLSSTQPRKSTSAKSISDIVDKLKAKSTSAPGTQPSCTLSTAVGVCSSTDTTTTNLADVDLGKESTVADQWRDNIFEKFCSTTPNSNASDSTAQSCSISSQPTGCEVSGSIVDPPESNSTSSRSTVESNLNKSNSFEIIKANTDTPASPTECLSSLSTTSATSTSTVSSKIIPISPTPTNKTAGNKMSLSYSPSTKKHHAMMPPYEQQQQQRKPMRFQRSASSGAGAGNGMIKAMGSRSSATDNYMYMNSVGVDSGSSGHSHLGPMHRRPSSNMHHNKSGNTFKSNPTWNPMDYPTNVSLDSAPNPSVGNNANCFASPWMMSPNVVPPPVGVCNLNPMSLFPIQHHGGSSAASSSTAPYPTIGVGRPARPNYGSQQSGPGGGSSSNNNNSSGSSNSFVRRHDSR